MNSSKRGHRPLWRSLSIIGLALCACGDEAPPAGSQLGKAGQMSPLPATQGTGGSSAIAGPPNTAAAGAGGPTTPAARAGSSAPSSGGSSGGAAPITAGEVTYHKDIRPIIEARCLGCHIDGGSGPFALDSWEKLQPLKGPVVVAVQSRRMPPWLADASNCTPIRDDQRLTEAQLALFKRWETAGFPAGNEAEFVPLPKPTQREIGEPSKLIKATRPFQLTGGTEDYYCLQTDADFSEDTWVTAMDMVPEHAEYVHHAIVNIGNTCSATGLLAANIYSYRPGSRTLVFEEGDALRVRAGANIMIQFHYNTKFKTRLDSLPTDQSAFRIWTLPPGQQPQREISRMPHHDMFINIPVGAVDQQEGGTQAIGYEYTPAGAEIIGISPHMHYLGQTFTETLGQADGSEVCLVNIPDWDQDWQLDYFYDPASYIKVAPGAFVTQGCTYSNRAEDQGTDPEGTKFTPQFTTYGENTRNEMCLGYIWFRYPLRGGL